MQRELEVAYLKIGDIQGKRYSPNLGNTEGAFESYRKALPILETLNHNNPENREVQKDLAAAYLSVGSLQDLRMLKSDDAVKNVQKTLVLRQALIAAEPTNIGI